MVEKVTPVQKYLDDLKAALDGNLQNRSTVVYLPKRHQKEVAKEFRSAGYKVEIVK